MATADNLKIAQQLLATMQQITAQVERQTEAYHAQAQLVDALCKAQECFGKIDAAKVKEVTDALKEAQEKTKEFGNELSNVSEKEVSKLGGALNELAEHMKSVNVPKEFINGFKDGITYSTNLFKNILSLGGSALGLLKDIGQNFLSFPGKIIEFFQNAAQGGVDPYRVALEELRGEFGDLKVGTSAAVKGMTENTKKLGESGLRLSRVFGYGREGLANMLKENMEMFKQMGPLANRLAASLRGAEGEFTLLRKATGLTGEAMKAFQLRAEETGMSGARATREMTLALAQGQKAFGISVKEFGKDIEVMLKDTITFGIKAPAEMVKISAYVKKLGISMETLKKVTDKAFNFEDAAQQAAKLSEAFGIALDPLKQMEADPVKKMDNLRQAFFKTGQRYESMTAQARKYLAEQAGISDEEARIAFSQKNRAMTGAQVEAQMKKQQKAQMSQAEAMKLLAESVQRLVRSGEPLKGSFIDIFVKGFERGVKRSREFREVVRKLQQSLRVVYWAGRDVGRMFIKEFPGIKTMLKSLSDMFNPRRFRELMKQVKEEFSKFFKALQTDPKAGVQEFMKNMKKIFFDFFTKGAPAGSRFLDGLKAFYKTVGAIFIEGARYALTALKDLLKIIVDFVKNPASLSSPASDALGEGIAGMVKQAFDYAVRELGPVLQEVGALFVDLFTTLYKKYIEPHLQDIFLGTLAFFLGPAIVGGIVRAGLGLLVQGLGSLLAGTSGIVNNIASGVTQTTKVTGPGGAVTETTISRQADTMDGIGRGMAKLAGTIAALAVGVAVAVFAIITLAKIYETSGIKLESFIAVGAMFGGIALITGILVQTRLFDLLGAIKPNPVAWAALGAIALLIGGMELAVLGIIGIAGLARNIPSETIEAVASLMVQMVGIFYAAAGLLAVATGIGAVIGVSLGTAAIAAVEGMAAISLAVIAIAETATVIISKFRNFNQPQVTMTATIMEKFIGFYNSVGETLKALLAYQSTAGQTSKVEEILIKLNNVIKTMSDGIVSTLDKLNISGDINEIQAKATLISAVLGGMSGIIAPLSNFATTYVKNNLPEDNIIKQFGNSISKIIGTLGSSIGNIIDKLRNMLYVVKDVDLIKGAGVAISSILQAIAGLVGGIMQLIPSGGGTSGVLAGMAAGAGIGMLAGPAGAAVGAIIGAAVGYAAESGQYQAKIKAMQDIITLVANSIKDLVKGIIDPLQTILTLPNISENGIRAAQALGPIFTGVASILSAVMKSADAIKAFEGLNRMTPEQARNVITDFKTLIESVGNSIRELIDSLKTFLTGSIVAIPTSISDNQLKVYDELGKIMSSIGTIIGTVLSSASNVMHDALHTPSGRVNASEVGDILAGVSRLLMDTIGQIPQVLSAMTENLPNLVKSINNVPTIPRDFLTKVYALKVTFEMLSSITAFFSNFIGVAREFDKGAETLTIEQSILGVKLQILQLLRFFSNSAGNGVPALIQSLITKISAFDFGGSGGTKNYLSKVSAIKSTFEALGSIVSSIKTMNDTFPTGGTNTNVTTKITQSLQNISSVLGAITSTTIEGQGEGDLNFNLNPLYDIDLHERIKTLNSLLKKSNLANNISSLSSKYNTIYQKISEFNGPEADISSSLRTRLSNALSAINTVATKIVENIETNPFNNISSPNNSLQKLAALDTSLRSSNITRKIQGLAQTIVPMMSSVAAIATNILDSSNVNSNGVQNALDNIFGMDDGLIARLEGYFGDEETEGTPARRIENITSKIKGRLTTNIQEMIRAYNSFSADLARFNSDINVQLRQAERGLGGRQTLAVRNAAVNAQINVQVSIDAQQIVAAMKTHSNRTTEAENDRFKTSAFTTARIPTG
jgi:hypothetical protein